MLSTHGCCVSSQQPLWGQWGGGEVDTSRRLLNLREGSGLWLPSCPRCKRRGTGRKVINIARCHPKPCWCSASPLTPAQFQPVAVGLAVHPHGCPPPLGTMPWFSSASSSSSSSSSLPPWDLSPAPCRSCMSVQAAVVCTAVHRAVCVQVCKGPFIRCARGPCVHRCVKRAECARGCKGQRVGTQSLMCAWVCMCKGLCVCTASQELLCVCVCVCTRGRVVQPLPPRPSVPAPPLGRGSPFHPPPRLPLTPRPIPVGPDLLHRIQIGPEKPRFPPERSGAAAPVRPA